MGESRLVVDEVLALCLQRIALEENAMSTELEFIEVVKKFESFRKKWLHAELELKKYKELLVKSDVAKAALEVKLKHARNQLDLEMKKRYRVEADYHYLQRQMQLMCDILVHDSKSSACLNDEQKSLLATFEHKGANATLLHRSNKRLCVIDESSFLSHSDISYDRTDDDVDVDTSVIKPLRSRARERRRSSMGVTVAAVVGRRGRSGNMFTEPLERRTVEKEVETIVEASVSTPDARAKIHMVVGITQGSPDNPTLCITQECAVSDCDEGGGVGDDTSVWCPCDEPEPEPEQEPEPEARLEESIIIRAEKTPKHVFVSKTVIWTETCSPCGKRIRFGKIAMKCRKCRVIAHPECKQKCVTVCSAATPGTTAQTNSLESFAPLKHPRVPQLIIECVTEIERRGLQERGLYRVPGGERLVKDLKDRFLQGKTPLMLSRVQDVHVLCGLLKDFLRTLKEPLVTFKLHRTFMEAGEMSDADSSTAAMFQAVAELPKTNKDTLAFLMLHFHKVMRSPRCQMDQNNLSRVFGPTLVGHGTSAPPPATILRDTLTQAKVVCRLLSFPEESWRRILDIRTNQTPSSSSSSSSSSTTKTSTQVEGNVRLFQPLTSPELNSYYTAAGRRSVRGPIRNQGAASGGNT
ncbi:rac GTPase-activating protein 1 [Scomber scombrus]|uniref:rac GTPase-activating protein 1 n=1 Tax=Scomber scombrus TaxID=13677 RepID=UPI002DD9A57A|nr:rac GTPase-activating protein 1 [Scomber scombrus]